MFLICLILTKNQNFQKTIFKMQQSYVDIYNIYPNRLQNKRKQSLR